MPSGHSWAPARQRLLGLEGLIARVIELAREKSAEPDVVFGNQDFAAQVARSRRGYSASMDIGRARMRLKQAQRSENSV